MRGGSGGAPPVGSDVTLRWAVRLLTLETAALVALLAFLVYVDLTAPAQSLTQALGLTLYIAVLAALLGLVTWSLWRRRRWARGPAVVLNLLLVPIGYTMAGTGLAWLGIPVMVVGIFGAGLLVAPSTRAALHAAEPPR